MAIGVGLALGAALLASLYFRKELFIVLAFAACVGALWELRQALRSRDMDIPLLPLVVGSAGMLVSAYVSGLEALLVAFVLTAGGVFVWRVLDGGGLRALRDAAAGVFAAAYVPFLAGFAVLMLAADGGEWRVLVFIALVVANDTGGFAAGVMFGAHPLAPSVSPKKSWEGAAGSLVLACAVGVGATFLTIDGFGSFGATVPWWLGLVLGAATVAAATVGDLGESLIKRDLGMKDMGAVLPGHGGILDRLDSLLVAAPVVAVTMTLLVPPTGG
nr:phosphatidate cytidylyltransferase [Beutenbergia cavernae]